eukprot:TRINITY_DN6267_c0_g1_i2.p1 TRINITY_DN6267_c0_g1~~TRINITY_DN6267_c0_g1_i2.p1  ORF type:complete len:159 (+),score=15.87 TRINITY_DN6267_c0_g1_i2:262-738(+)
MATEIEALMRIQHQFESTNEQETQQALNQYQLHLRSLFSKAFKQPLKGRYNEAALHVLLSSLESIDGLLHDGIEQDVPIHTFLVHHLFTVFVDPHGAKHHAAALNCYCSLGRHLQRSPALLAQYLHFHSELLPFLCRLASNATVSFPIRCQVHKSLPE